MRQDSYRRYSSVFFRASSKDGNQLSLRHSARSLASKDTIMALPVGSPGRMKFSSTPLR